ncbi:polysaccharide deacetylase family protein [Alicyclobacillus sp. SO9]|uniref:polysaccharide deacetylase family protein n=1 Tax=Alicyclobacillus sp. SO9 TaxID=2665646 RepID=UPI0018E80599|nr:polysaccharide deacetylase family protein [Alicyclobacillus sp. SO9]QQE77679.1 polysaccharide deacetylase family protein [Alicyclobacillus sp. SO9]
MKYTISALLTTALCSTLMTGCNATQPVPSTANTATNTTANIMAKTNLQPTAVEKRTAPVRPAHPPKPPLPSTVSGPLPDPYWIADPKNYEVDAHKTVNEHVPVPILEYHEVNYWPGDAATLKPGQFKQEIKWLHQEGFHTINLGQLYGAMYFGYKLPKRPVVLNFDDGYESTYLKAFPILKNYGYQGTVFMVSGFVLNKPNRAVRFPKLTASELRIMQQSGLIDIESHTVHHTNLDTVSLTRAKAELTQSSRSLQRVVHHPMKFFCYPYGGYTKSELTTVKQAGYILAVTEHEGYANARQGAVTLDRIPVLDYTTMQQFKAKLQPSLR